MQTLGKHLVTWWEKYSRIIKLLFVTSVLIFVIHALGNFFKTVKWQQVGTGLANLSWANIVLLFVAGCVAVVPMLGYDFAILHFLPGKFTAKTLVKRKSCWQSPKLRSSSSPACRFSAGLP